MLYDKDEDEENEELTEYEGWFIENDYYFPSELRYIGMDSLELELFYYRVYKPVVAEMLVNLRKVMMEQHPSMSREIRPRILEQINNIVPNLAHEWITRLYALVYYDENGFNLREKYDSFKHWEKRNAHLQRIAKQEKEDMEEYEDLSDNEVEYLEDRIKKREIKEYRQYRRRRAAVHEAFMSPVLNYFDRVLNISGDAWVVFAGLTEDYFIQYREYASHWNTFFKLGFPEEYIDLDAVKYQEILMETLTQKQHWSLRVGRDLAEEDRE